MCIRPQPRLGAGGSLATRRHHCNTALLCNYAVGEDFPMQMVIQYPHPAAPTVVYYPTPGASGGGPSGSGPGYTGVPRTSGQGPIITPDSDLGAILSRDPNRSRGDAALPPGANEVPVHGSLPVLGVPAPNENVFHRVDGGGRSLIRDLSYDDKVRYIDFMKRTGSGREHAWFRLNPGS